MGRHGKYPRAKRCNTNWKQRDIHAAMQVDAGLEALAGALAAGFDDFKTVRTDSSLDNLRKSKKFTPLINKYDEPFINESAIK